MAGTRTLNSEPRSTAYYYGDLEKIKRQDTLKNDEIPVLDAGVVNEAPIREVPPLRDRQWSLPEYSTPENSRHIDFDNLPKVDREENCPNFDRDHQICRIADHQQNSRNLDQLQNRNFDPIPFDDRKLDKAVDNESRNDESRKVSPENRKGETYSTAGTFPMPEAKEKEPLLAELEVVGRVPLSQLEPGVTRSRSWYLCCPNVGEEEISRESSWRYSSLRPVTSPPAPGQNGGAGIMLTSSPHIEDLASLRSERDALARALSAERHRSAAAARAHDARLAELHGVIAELVRRRGPSAAVIPEEEGSDECESTTQPAGELDNDGDLSRTDQNESSSILSPSSLPTPQEKADPADTDASAHDRVEPDSQDCDGSLNLSDKLSDGCLSTARCGEPAAGASTTSCEREHGSEPRLYAHAQVADRCESRSPKLASRVRLPRAAGGPRARPPRALGDDDDDAGSDTELWRVRYARVRAECAVLQASLARAADTAHRLYSWSAAHEQAVVSLCLALRAADRALEAYDVLLALAETRAPAAHQRAAAELVALQLLARLEGEAPALGEPLLSPGPWLDHHNHAVAGCWSAAAERRLRAHAARLKGRTAALRPPASPALFTYHDTPEDEAPKPGDLDMAELEAYILMEESLANSEAKLMRESRPAPAPAAAHQKESARSRRRRSRHWLDTQASETDL